MHETRNAQTLGHRTVVDSLDREFARLHAQSCRITEGIDDQVLYVKAGKSGHSVGEALLRCAAEIEQTFGGITANLWDDPFEWTLPEHLSTRPKIIEHLGEVETLRKRAFESFSDDDCLSKQVATPSGTCALVDLLLGTLLRANEYQTQAVCAVKFLSSIQAAGFII
ncbi:MAG TPA: hypothetical protein VJU86_11845 [Pyrinomonadaceae bacterium]|nr:hypothetical protein [Pyrinomonadaceae bacterium]